MAPEVCSAAGAPPAVLAPGFAPATKAIREREERPAPRARAFFTFYAGVSQEGGGREGPASSPLTLTTQEDRCLVSCVNPPLSQSRGEPHACARSPFSSVRIGSHPGPPIRGGSFFRVGLADCREDRSPQGSGQDRAGFLASDDGFATFCAPRAPRRPRSVPARPWKTPGRDFSTLAQELLMAEKTLQTRHHLPEKARFAAR